MLGSLLPGPGSWLPGSSAAPQSVSPWPPQPGDPGAATRNGAAQITAAAGRQGGLCAPLCSCTRSHTRRRALPPAEAPRALPARAQARTRTEAPSPAGKPTPTPSLLRGTRRPNLRSRCWQTLLPHPLIFTGTRPPSNYSPARALALAFSPTLCEPLPQDFSNSPCQSPSLASKVYENVLQLLRTTQSFPEAPSLMCSFGCCSLTSL